MPEPDASLALTLTRFHDPTAFARVAEPLMLRDEAANCLQLGLLDALRAGQYREPFLATVDAYGGQPLLSVMMTPPYRLILGEPAAERDAAALLAPVLDALPAGLPGVLGPVDLSGCFAEAYARRHGVSATLAMAERIYRCERVTPPSGVAGRMRRATAADLELLVAWRRAFREEAATGDPASDREAVERDLSQDPGGLWFWEVDGEPVSMAGARGPTPSGIRVGPVYTPPELRGRGYAGTLVGALTQLLLDEGRRFVFLFTDLANPTSNALYQRLGYRGVADRSVYDFSA